MQRELKIKIQIDRNAIYPLLELDDFAKKSQKLKKPSHLQNWRLVSFIHKKTTFCIFVVFLMSTSLPIKVNVKVFTIGKFAKITARKTSPCMRNSRSIDTKKHFSCVFVVLRLEQLAITVKKLKKFYIWNYIWCAEKWNSRRISSLENCFAVTGALLRNNCSFFGK